MKRLLPLLLLGLGTSAMASKSEFNEVSDALCGKMKECAFGAMQEKNNISPDMKAMVEKMLDDTCKSMKDAYSPAMESHELYEPAVACIRSLSVMSCGAMKTMNRESPTPECKTFRELEEKHKAKAK